METPELTLIVARIVHAQECKCGKDLSDHYPTYIKYIKEIANHAIDQFANIVSYKQTGFYSGGLVTGLEEIAKKAAINGQG